MHCCIFALEFQDAACSDVSDFRTQWEACMKKLATVIALVVASLSLAGCFVGKGKGKAPPPVVTKG